MGAEKLTLLILELRCSVRRTEEKLEITLVFLLKRYLKTLKRNAYLCQVQRLHAKHLKAEVYILKRKKVVAHTVP
jgi:hypothetical protein